MAGNLNEDELREIRDKLSPKLHELAQDLSSVGDQVYEIALDYYQSIQDRIMALHPEWSEEDDA